MSYVRKAVLGIALVAAASLPVADRSPVHAAPAGTGPVGTITVDPPSGTSDTPYRLIPIGGNALDPTNAYCPGDAANQGYRWQTFLAPVAVDLATLEYDGEGVHTTRAEDAPYSDHVWNLWSVGQDPIRDNNPALNPAGFLDLSGWRFSMAVFEGWDLIPAGRYNIGIACTRNRITETYFALQIDVAADFSYSAVQPLGAPVLSDPLGVGDGSLTATFAMDPVPEPPVTGFTVTATPTAGGTPVVVEATASPVQITGLVNGTQYRVTVTATRGASTSAPSNEVVGTPVAGAEATTTTTTTAPPDPDDTTTTTAPLPGDDTSTSSTAVAAPVTGPNTSLDPTTANGALPRTGGGSTLAIAVWAALILVAGRVVFLVGRRPKVLPPK